MIIFAFFITLILLGVGFLNRTGAEIGTFYFFSTKNTASAQLWDNKQDGTALSELMSFNNSYFNTS